MDQFSLSLPTGSGSGESEPFWSVSLLVLIFLLRQQQSACSVAKLDSQHEDDEEEEADDGAAEATQETSNSPQNNECSICLEIKETDLFPQSAVSASCTHPPAACLECLEVSIRSELNNKIWSGISCPECPERLDYANIQRYADEETFGRYEILSIRAAMAESEGFVWCTSDCGSGQIHESGRDQPIVTCTHCGHLSCFQHNVAWHQNLTCDEYDQLLADPDNFRSRFETDNEDRTAEQPLDTNKATAQGVEEQDAGEEMELARQSAARRKEEEEKSMETVLGISKPCPGCGWAIEKNEGCSHMTCIKCRHEFCWCCYQTWNDSHRYDCRG